MPGCGGDQVKKKGKTPQKLTLACLLLLDLCPIAAALCTIPSLLGLFCRMSGTSVTVASAGRVAGLCSRMP